MKRIINTLLILCLCSPLSAQLVTKMAMPKAEAAAKDSITDPLITEANKLIAAFNNNKSDSLLQAVITFLKKNTTDPSQSFSKTGDNLFTLIFTKRDSLMTAGITPLAERKVAVKAKAGAQSETCPTLSQVTDIKVEKNDDAEYIVSLVDKDENPLKIFTLTQFNEELYRDKIQKALYSLCDQTPTEADTTLIKGLWEQMKKQGLYTHMLEASLEVKDDNVLAGELKIMKTPPINLWINAKRVDSNNKLLKDARSFYTDQPIASDLTWQKRSDSTKKMDSTLRQVMNMISKMKPDSTWKKVIDTISKIKSDSTVRKDKPELYKVFGFKVHDISIQFQDGFIENIIVQGKWDYYPGLLKFENVSPIPFSTRRDFRTLYDYFIYEKTFFSTKRSKDGVQGPCSIRLGDLLYYAQNLDIDSKDYSPFNHVYKSTITDSITTVNLYKEKTSKILELKIFSDLKGIENNNPNGLVQLELSRKLNFWNNRITIPRLKNMKRPNLFNIGFLNSVTPYFTMNKVENNQKRLIPSYLGTQQKDTLQPNVFASTLKLFQYQTFGLGANFSIMIFDIPGLKSTISFNTGFYYGRTLLQDTLRVKTDSSNFKPIDANNVNNYGVNTFRRTHEVAWQIFPDKRYGMTVSQQFTNFRLLNDQLKQVRDSADYTGYLKSLKGDRSKIDAYEYKKWLATTEVYAFYRPSEYNRVFFRYRFNWDLQNIKENFHQIQLGISTYLTHTKKDKKEESQQ